MKREHMVQPTEHVDYYLYNLDDFKELKNRIKNGTEASGTRFHNGTTGYAGKVFQMANDIDFQNYAWEGIGNMPSGYSFQGTLDGNYHKITNYKTVNNTQEYNNTYFIFINNAVVKNITLSGSYSLTANTQHYFILGNNSQISNVSFEVNVTNASNMTFCILGENNIITDVFNFGNIATTSPGYNAPGFVNTSGIVERCGNYGNISYSGGRDKICQFIQLRGTNSNLYVRNCINAGNMTNSMNRNVGICYYAYEATNTLFCGSATISSSNSSLTAYPTPTVYSNNYYDSTKNNPQYNPGYNGTGMSTSDLKSGNNIFSNTTDWIYETGYYPRLNNWMKNDSRVKI